jgi:hypothetical protein
MDEHESEFLENPDMREKDAAPMCFMNHLRPCGPECLAYVTHPRRAKASELSEEQVHCALISNAERVGRGSVMAANAVTEVAVSLKKFISTSRNAVADKQRQASLAIQATSSPFGGKPQQ